MELNEGNKSVSFFLMEWTWFRFKKQKWNLHQWILLRAEGYRGFWDRELLIPGGLVGYWCLVQHDFGVVGHGNWSSLFPVKQENQKVHWAIFCLLHHLVLICKLNDVWDHHTRPNFFYPFPFPFLFQFVLAMRDNEKRSWSFNILIIWYQLG